MHLRTILCCATLALSAFPAFADTPAPTPTAAAAAPAAPAVDPAKRALIEQLLTVMRTEQQSDALAKAILAQSPEIIEQIFPPDPNLTAAQQAAATQEAERMQNRFVELFKQNVDIPAIVRSVTFDLYDKYFTAAELKDLIVFYKTPTGQKAIDLLPQISQESMRLTDDALAPKVKAIVAQLQDEESKRLKATPVPAAPASK